jgi:arabinogalactan oligomer/maltooligosaccharide transport system substrate-binding protein
MAKFSRVSTCVLCFLFILTACSGDKDSSENSQPPNPLPQATLAPQPLLIWHPYGVAQQNALERIRQNFQTSFPDIPVQIESIEDAEFVTQFENAVNAGAGPDLVLGPADWLISLTMQGLLQPISQSLMDQATDILSESVATSTSAEGSPYGVPFAVEIATLYYNRSLVTETSDIFDDLLTQAAASGMVITPNFFATSGLFFSSGGLLMSNEGENYLTRTFLKLFLDELHSVASAAGITFSTDQTTFEQGQVGFLLASSAHYASLKTALGDNLGVARLPRIPPAQWSTLIMMQTAMLSLNATAEAARASTAFVSFLISPESQGIWFEETGQVPANPRGLVDDSLRIAWSTTLEWGRPAPLPDKFDRIMYPELDRAVEAVLLDGADSETVAVQTMENLEANFQ